MVVILKFDSNVEEFYSTLFMELNIDYKISLRENDISRAEHIILPDTDLLIKVIKKLQLMNLYSLLRMKNVPILGVNNGMVLMCNKIVDINKTGLGFFNINANTISVNDEKGEEIKETEFRKVDKSKLLTDTSEIVKFNKKKKYLKSNHFSTSKINIDKNKYSFIMEKDNYFGIQIDIKENKDLFKKILTNFIKL
jgi:imidazoleglycerol phosphate synthase glutamine amidotransferase subunit HisH